MEAEIVKLEPKRKHVRTRPVAEAIATGSMRRKWLRQKAAAGAIGAVATTLTALSLTHLAHGVEIVTHTAGWEAWAFAIGIDLGFIALEIANLSCATVTVERAIARWTNTAIVGTLAGSAVMNATAFAADVTGELAYAAAALCIAIPALVYVLTRVGVDLYTTATR